MTWDNLHDEDILYEFRGDDASHLTAGRFYQGTVDGFADFGVFVTLGDSVTGLLHRSKLPRRLESLDWAEGDDVIVRVDAVRDNGNIDLDWSIRQSSDEFRGAAVDKPDGTREPTPEPRETEAVDRPAPPVDESGVASSIGGQLVEAVASADAAELVDQPGERVRLEGRITDVTQTSGPTVFTLADESGQVDCAAFESAGVRAYPAVEEGDLVRLIGVVERHRGQVQIETESIDPLEGVERESVDARLEDAARERAAPSDTSPLVDDPSMTQLRDDLVDLATRLRAAVLDARPIVVRHPPTVDGIVGGAAIERALRFAVAAEHPGEAADIRSILRRPSREPWYDLGDAMYDLGVDPERNVPVVLLVGLGTSALDREALQFLSIYGVERLIVDAFSRAQPVDDVGEAAAVAGDERTAATVAAHLAGLIETDVRTQLAPLPAISYRDEPPEPYARLAADRGIDAETVRERHQALALIAYYQRYDDKRELVADLLFDGDEAANLARHVSTQYRERMADAIGIAQANCDRETVAERSICVLDAEEHSHRFDFPPRSLLAEELFDAEAETNEIDAVVVLETDAAHFATDADIDLNAIAETVAERVPDAAVRAARARITFLAGKREAVRSALLTVLADRVG